MISSSNSIAALIEKLNTESTETHREKRNSRIIFFLGAPRCSRCLIFSLGNRKVSEWFL